MALGACAGEQRRFSEQQVMDCSWRDGNEACDGGDYDTAIDYLVQARARRRPTQLPRLRGSHGCSELPQSRRFVMSVVWSPACKPSMIVCFLLEFT